MGDGHGLGLWVMNFCKYSRTRFDVYIVYDSLRLVFFTTIFPNSFTRGCKQLLLFVQIILF
jgi:hypothetical protein